MNRIKLILYTVLALVFFYITPTYCQVSANTSGGDATGSGGSVAYSIGQVVYTSIGDGTASLSQGIQQAFEIFKVNTIETESKIQMNVFPNPTMGILMLTTEFMDQSLAYKIHDTFGKQLDFGRIETQTTYIDMNHLPVATYFINIINSDNTILQSFKIIKN